MPSVRVYVIELLKKNGRIFTKFGVNIKPFEVAPASKILISHNNNNDNNDDDDDNNKNNNNTTDARS
jgi:hypothetical protein